MSDDLRIRTLGNDSLAVSQENLHSVDKSTVPNTLQNESQEAEMQGHLPECQLATSVYDDRADCICPELRACELRVRTEPFDVAYLAGLNAAEKAILELHYPLQNVTTLQWCSECSGFDGDEIEWPCRTVEQIRSLKEKP